MSNKPRVYATCPAGCLHETIHREDFLRSAAYIKQIEQAEGYILEQGRTYRLKKRFEGATSWGFPFAIVYSYKWDADGVVSTQTETVEITLPAPTEFDDYAKIKICGYKWDKEFILVYEYNGTKYEESCAAFSYLPDYGITVYGWAQDAGGCWLVNEDAETVARDGDTGAAIVSTILIGQDENGGNIYEQTFDNGVTAQFVAPKGEKGDAGVKIVSTVLKGQDENGGNIYEQTFDNGTTAQFVAPKGEKGFVNVVQGTGDSEEDAMSQNAVTKELSTRDEKIKTLENSITLMKSDIQNIQNDIIGAMEGDY